MAASAADRWPPVRPSLIRISYDVTFACSPIPIICSQASNDLPLLVVVLSSDAISLLLLLLLLLLMMMMYSEPVVDVVYWPRVCIVMALPVLLLLFLTPTSHRHIVHGQQLADVAVSNQWLLSAYPVRTLTVMFFAVITIRWRA